MVGVDPSAFMLLGCTTKKGTRVPSLLVANFCSTTNWLGSTGTFSSYQGAVLPVLTLVSKILVGNVKLWNE